MVLSSSPLTDEQIIIRNLMSRNTPTPEQKEIFRKKCQWANRKHARKVLIKNTIKSTLKKIDLKLEDDIDVLIFDDTTSVDLAISEDKCKETDYECKKGDILIQYTIWVNGANCEFVMAQKTIVIHSKKLGYDLEQIKRLCKEMTAQNDECVEHVPWL